VANTYDRRVPPGGGILIGLVIGIMLWLSLIGIANAQTFKTQEPQQFYIFADSAGISPMPGMVNTYVTWVYARATPTSYPSSGVLVAWDCTAKKVKRLAQVKYQMRADSTGVFGDIVEVDRDWQDVSDERLAMMVCRVGPEHDGTATHPDLAPGKPRIDS
jgi:hypothetical protein